MKDLNKSCFMCGATSSDGIILNGEKICKACEEKIVNTTVISNDYNVYKDAVKVILFNEHANDKFFIYKHFKVGIYNEKGFIHSI